MKISDLLLEGISPILYHATSLPTLKKILDSDTFRLTPDIGTRHEKGLRKGDKVYYMSTSRSKTGDYHYPVSKHANGQSVIVLDGRKLMADGYSGQSMDYWGAGWGKDEMEDRIFSKKPNIPDAKKYIKEVHTYINLDADTDRYDQRVRDARKVAIDLHKDGIPFYVYTDPKNLNLLNKNKAIKLSTLKAKEKAQKPYSYSGSRQPGSMSGLIELLKIDDKEKLSDRAQKQLYKLKYDAGFSDDNIRSIEADIHNARNRDSDRDHLDRFIKLMQQHNLKDVRELVNHIKDKFKDV